MDAGKRRAVCAVHDVAYADCAGDEGYFDALIPAFPHRHTCT